MRRAPRRIQRKRTKGWRMPAGAVYVGRPTVFGNPWLLWPGADREELVAQFRLWLASRDSRYPWAEQRDALLHRLPELRGKDLACWCPLPKAGGPDHCHAAVLLELANR